MYRDSMRLRTRPRGVWAVIFGVAVCGAGGANAQRQVEHRGFWISPGLVFAATFSDPYNVGEQDDPGRGGGIGIRLGGTLSQHVLLGGESSGWTAGSGIIRGHSAVTVLYYPGENGGVFGRALVGLAHRSVSFSILTEYDGEFQFLDLEENNTGLGLGGGIGYDLRLARNFFLTPSADAIVQYLADHWSPIVIFTLNATWH